MSIRDALKEALSAGRLAQFRHPLGWDSAPRVFLMTPKLVAQRSEATQADDPKRVERWERLGADIAHYVSNGYINWNLMRWLDPHKFEHWELRSVRPKPSIRVFGRFAEPDVFVGTHAVERAPLAAKWSLAWEMEKLICEDGWKEAVGDLPPFTADDYESYITENASKDVRVDR
jgi:hypothetical protein